MPNINIKKDISASNVNGIFWFTTDLLHHPTNLHDSGDDTGGGVPDPYVHFPENKEEVQKTSEYFSSKTARENLLTVATGGECLKKCAWYHGKI